MNMTMKLVVVIAVLLAVTGVVVLKNTDKTTPEQVSEATQPTEEVQTEVPEEPSVDQAQSAPAVLPQLLDLGADKCIPCKAMAPILETMREDFAGQFDVVFIDVWENTGAGEVYNVSVIPTQIFFDTEGNELFRHVGFYSREEILGKWQELGYEFSTNGGT